MADLPQFSWQFKGGRDYLHGTDIYDLACEALAKEGHLALRNVDLTLHKIARTTLVAKLTPKGTPAEPGVAALMQFSSDAGDFALQFLPTEMPVETRRPYAEDDIAAAAELNLTEKTIALHSAIPFSNVELVVAMNKALLQALFPDAPGKWYFTRLQLKESFHARRFASIVMKFEVNLDFALTRTAIVADGQQIGRIYFSLVRS